MSSKKKEKKRKKEGNVDVNLECILFYFNLIASQIDDVKFLFVQRSGNLVAHSVASFVALHGGFYLWDAIGLDFLFNIIVEDVNIAIKN